ncbi:GNAT family N-acetyltransferase [Streptomyces chrestomyceticus]|uniref:GNAT family N-acetyltransferase n=1 Tax=Streptomyces chrestomyceticus TaxID=68185 RepID=UPI0037AE3151
MIGTRTASCTVSVADSVQEVGRRAWTSLVEACGAPVFYSYDFLSSVEKLPLTSPSRARYLVAREEPAGEPVAVLPVYLQHTRDPFATGPGADALLTVLMGHVWHCYDTVLPSRVPLTAPLVETFWTALGELADSSDVDLWGLANVAADGELARLLTEIGVATESTVPRYRLPLAGGPATLDEHLTTVSRPSRRTLRQFARRARDAGAEITLRQGSEALDQDVLDLCEATADKHAPGYYPPDRLAALVNALGPDCGILRVDLDGVLLAVSLCLYDRTRMHAWAGGCLYPQELNWSPQYVLFAAELEAGMASGRQVLECGRRNDEFKTRYGLHAQPLVRAAVRR